MVMVATRNDLKFEIDYSIKNNQEQGSNEQNLWKHKRRLYLEAESDI